MSSSFRGDGVPLHRHLGLSTGDVRLPATFLLVDLRLRTRQRFSTEIGEGDLERVAPRSVAEADR